MKHLPTVAVVLPCYNEDPEMVKKNLVRMRDLNYDKGRVRFYLLDDSASPRRT